MLWRQGDVFIESVALIPGGAVQLSHLVLVEGELTGHSHRIAELDSALLYEVRGELFLQVISPHAELIHQEHRSIRLPRGKYRVWRQREFDPGARTLRLGVAGSTWHDPRLGSSRWVID